MNHDLNRVSAACTSSVESFNSLFQFVVMSYELLNVHFARLDHFNGERVAGTNYALLV